MDPDAFVSFWIAKTVFEHAKTPLNDLKSEFLFCWKICIWQPTESNKWNGTEKQPCVLNKLANLI